MQNKTPIRVNVTVLKQMLNLIPRRLIQGDWLDPHKAFLQKRLK